jgi:tRNA(Ile)-lysidine synthase
MVAGVCNGLSVPHSTLVVNWKRKPQTALQERARLERYRLLAAWATERDVSAIATAHHLDDQAETLLMRLNRGAGVRGLAGMRAGAPVPLGKKRLRLLRPLLTWRRSELVELCSAAGLEPVDDPSNSDEQFERVRIRNALAGAEWLDSRAIAQSAAHLASADVALHWATDVEWESQVKRSGAEITYRPSAPFEIRRRVVRRSVAALATEGQANPLRGRELDKLVAVLSKGGKGTLRGVLCSGGETWRFTPAPRRRTLN